MDALYNAVMPATVRNKAEKLLAARGVIKTHEFEEAGIPRTLLPELLNEGVLVRNARGVYTSLKAPGSAHNSLAQVATIAPGVVVCLLSALRFHELTTESPTEVWIALAPNSRTPSVELPPIHAVRFSASSFTEGIEEHMIDKVPVRIYSIAKTVADCFKFRNKIGKDVAIEALRDAWNQKRVTSDDLRRCAEACRMVNVMRPYLESIIS
jgi:predicted transcriptional regulator of viral defense system